MAKRKITDGLPSGTFICISKPDTGAVCFTTDEISGLLEKLATNTKPALNP